MINSRVQLVLRITSLELTELIPDLRLNVIFPSLKYALFITFVQPKSKNSFHSPQNLSFPHQNPSGEGISDIVYIFIKTQINLTYLTTSTIQKVLGGPQAIDICGVI